MRLIVFRAMIALLAGFGSTANAAEATVLSAAAMKSVIVPGLPAGNPDIPATFGTAGQMHDAAVNGQTFDVIIIPPAPMADLVKRGLVDPASVRPVGVMRLGVAVAKGQPQPLIDTPEHVVAMLSQVPTLAVADGKTGATTGIYLAKLFETLGLSASLQPRLKLFPDGQAAMEAVARGEASVAIGQVSEAKPVAGLDVVGVLPDSMQLKTTYSAAIAARPIDRARAERTMAQMRGDRFRALLRDQGFEVTD